MSIFTKRTIIVWSKDTYASMISTAETPATNPAIDEFDQKTQEFIDNNKMDPDFSELRSEDTTIISIKHVTDESTAQEWIDFNTGLATKYNLTMVSSRIRPIV